MLQTEKLLLYGGAIHEAGTVKARRSARHATSDWMELEKQRGGHAPAYPQLILISRPAFTPLSCSPCHLWACLGASQL